MPSSHGIDWTPLTNSTTVLTAAVGAIPVLLATVYYGGTVLGWVMKWLRAGQNPAREPSIAPKRPKAPGYMVPSSRTDGAEPRVRSKIRNSMRRALRRRQDRRRKAIFLKFPSRRVAKLRWADFEWIIEEHIHEDRTTTPCADNIVLEVDRTTGIVNLRGLADGLITIACYAVSQDRNTYLGIARCGETEGRIDNKAMLRLTADNKIRVDITPRNRAVAPLRCIFGRQAKQP